LPFLSTRLFRRASPLLAAVVLLTALAVPASAIDGDAYVTLGNQKRASVGLAAVSWWSVADQISIDRADAMAATDNFVHDMAYVESRLNASGTCYTGYGEIIAWEKGYPTYDPARTMEQWWASPTHHDIIVGDYNAASGSHATSAATGRLYSVMIFVKLCSPPPSGGDTTFTRLAGSDRYATAAALSQARFGSGASTVFIATGASFPDALAGSPAAAVAGGPILLTARDGLPTATANELARLRPSRIVILGGAGVVSDHVANQLRGHASHVERWWGADRFETAAAISRATFGPGVALVYLATGSTFPDALSGGAVAGRNHGPILLVGRDSIPGPTANELARLRPQQIVVLGGSGVISEAVRIAAAGFATSGSATRLAGADRFATSVEISRSAYGGGGDTVFIATGTNFPDGLAGGAVAALVPGPILLVTPTQLPASIAAELQRLDPDTVYVIGGTGAISNGVVNAMDAVLP
jgi:putative cell wall-binding protein